MIHTPKDFFSLLSVPSLAIISRCIALSTSRQDALGGKSFPSISEIVAKAHFFDAEFSRFPKMELTTMAIALEITVAFLGVR